MVTPVEELRSAAVLLRQRAEAATPGPWTAHADGLVWPSVLGDPAAGADIVENADYISTMDPLVGLALAELFDHISDDMDDDGAEEAPIAESKLVVRSTIPATFWRWDWTAALALARLILGGTS